MNPHGLFTSINVLIAHGTPLEISGSTLDEDVGLGTTIEFEGSDASPYPKLFEASTVNE
jgi:hypothetical protein